MGERAENNNQKFQNFFKSIPATLPVAPDLIFFCVRVCRKAMACHCMR